MLEGKEPLLDSDIEICEKAVDSEEEKEYSKCLIKENRKYNAYKFIDMSKHNLYGAKSL